MERTTQEARPRSCCTRVALDPVRGIMWVIEAQPASILVPRDHLHVNQKRVTIPAIRCTFEVAEFVAVTV